MKKTNSLTPEAKEIIVNKGTESCNRANNEQISKEGTYICRNCGIALFSSKSKFFSGTGWPSFDQALEGRIKTITDKDGIRYEILCARCDAHLGHVFTGEKFTKLDTRYCVNSITLEFIAYIDIDDTEEAIVAAGCFWGVEYYFKKLKGVVKIEVGYTGGYVEYPNYEQICNSQTRHVEAVRIIYNPRLIDYKHIIQFFFEIHDFEQINGQGPDIGEQYLSKIFYYNHKQYEQAKNIILTLQNRGFKVATSLAQVTTFWQAEEYHQEYYNKNRQLPYCHAPKQIF